MGRGVGTPQQAQEFMDKYGLKILIAIGIIGLIFLFIGWISSGFQP